MKENNNINIQRSRGTSVEQIVSRALLARGVRVDPRCAYTKARMRVTNNEESNSNITNHLDTIFEKVLPPISKRQSFQLKQDSAGHLEHSSSDIVVHCCPDIHFSIKHNNTSLKHPKANKLYRQMRMSDENAEVFKQKYARINDRFYKAWKTFKSFAMLPLGEKTRMYREINELVLREIRRAPRESIDSYLDFLLDLPIDNKYIIKCDTVKGSASLLQLAQEKKSAKKSKVDAHISASGTTIDLVYRGYQVSIRLHNCKTRLSPTLGLKYDVHVHNVWTVVI